MNPLRDTPTPCRHCRERWWFHVALSRVLVWVPCDVSLYIKKLLVKANEDKERLKNRDVFAQIIKVGLPSAMETALYNVAMTLTIRFLNQMDESGFNVTARAYAAQIANFSYCAGAALVQANVCFCGGSRESGGQKDL